MKTKLINDAPVIMATKASLILLFIIVFSCMLTPVIAQKDSSGFTDKADAKNETRNGLKEGKWLEYLNVTDGVTDSDQYRLTVYKAGKPYGIVWTYYTSGMMATPYNGNGLKNGMEISYYDSDEIWMETPWVNDIENVSIQPSTS